MEQIALFRCKAGFADVPEEQAQAYLKSAEADILFYLNLTESAPFLNSSIAELAALRYRHDLLPDGVKAHAYTEQDVSESTTYQTGADFLDQEAAVFQRLSRFRRVAPHV